MNGVSAAQFLTSGDLHVVLDYIIPVTALGIATKLLSKLKFVRAFVRGFRAFREDWFGDPGRPGVESRPGVMERLQTVEKTTSEAHTIATETRDMATETRDSVVKLSANVDWLLHELQPNSGSSLRDQMDKVVEHLTGSKTPTSPPPPQQ